MMKVTVILNNSNEESILSVQQQTHGDWELLIESEGESEHGRIKYVKYYNPSELNGEAVLFLRGGDKLLPTALELLVAADVDIAEGSTKEFKYKNPTRFSVHEKELSLPQYSSAVLIKRAVLEANDWDLGQITKKSGTYEHITTPVAEKFFSQDVINKWEFQREMRRRRQMKLSVIFGVRSRARYVKRVIRSLLVQDLPRDLYNIIVVDFGSQDDLAEYINLIKANNVKLIKVPEATQYDRALAFNIGAKSTDHELLIFTESDLLFPKYALRMLRDALVTKIDHVFQIKQKELNKLQTCTIISQTYANYDELVQKAPSTKAAGVSGAILIERSIFESVGGFDEDFSGESYETEDFLERLRLTGVPVTTVDDIAVLHMWHEKSEEKPAGYFWELYQRKTGGNPVCNIGKDWGILIRKRPTVLFMLSPRTWECGSICKYVSRFLKPYYKIDMCGARGELRGKTSGKYDIVYTSDWRLPRNFKPDTSRFVTGIYDFTSWTDPSGHNVGTDQFRDRIQLFEAVNTPSEELRSVLLEYHPNTFYTPVGVDTEFFRPLKQHRVSNNFTVGWVGFEEPKLTVEGYLEHIKPVCHQLSGIDLFSAPGGEDFNGHMQMLGFYNAIDVFVQFPESAGHSKSMLEAMACGKPAITSKQGDVDKAIVSGKNGIALASRSEEALSTTLLTIRDREEYTQQMGEQARAQVVKNFDWRDKAHYWKEFFDFVMDMS